MHATDHSATTIVLEPRTGWHGLALGDLFRYRDLLWILALRDIQVRYKQTALGALWAVIQPLVLMIVFSVFLGPYTGVDDPVVLYTGLLPWTFFAAAVSASSSSLVNNAGMLGKIYFPRLLVPLAALGAPMVDFAIAMLVLMGMMLWFSVPITAGLLLIPVILAIAVTTAAGVGILLAALTVSYRDFRYVVPFMLQVWFFLSGIIVPLPAWVGYLNPIAGVVAAFRAAVMGEAVEPIALLSAAVGAALLLPLGLIVFARTERRFADVI